MNRNVVIGISVFVSVVAIIVGVVLYYKRQFLDSIRGTVRSPGNIEFQVLLNDDPKPVYTAKLEAGKEHSFNFVPSVNKEDIKVIRFKPGNFAFVNKDLHAFNKPLLPLQSGKYHVSVFSNVGPAGIFPKTSFEFSQDKKRIIGPKSGFVGTEGAKFTPLVGGSFAWGGRTYSIFLD